MKIYLNNREFVLAPFDSSILFLISVPQISQTVWSPHTVERTLQDSCLPFLRSACTMARLVYNINLPEVEVRPSPIVGVKTNAGRESFMTSVSSPLEKRKGELEPKCVLQLFPVSLLGMRRSAIGQLFFLSLLTIPEVFAKVNSTQFPCLF